MATSTVKPNGDGTIVNWTSSGGGSLYLMIDEGISGADDATTYIRQGSSTGSAYFLLEDFPANFGTATAVTVTVRHTVSTTKGDRKGYTLRLYQSDESTAITSATSQQNPPAGYATSSPISLTITGATTKTAWDGARLQITGFGSNGNLDISAIDVEVTYTTSAQTYNETGSGGAVGGGVAVDSHIPSLPPNGTESGEFQVISSGDDAYENFTGQVDVTATSAISNREDEYVGFRFRNVNIEQGTTVSTAYLQVFVTDASAADPDHTIWGEDIDDAPMFQETDDNLSSRTSTTATVNWASTDLAVADDFATSPNIGPIIHEIVNRAGWEAGNSIVIIINRRVGAGLARELGVNFYDNDPAEGAILTINSIEYGGGVVGGDAVVQEINAAGDTVIDSIEYRKPISLILARINRAFIVREFADKPYRNSPDRINSLDRI